jgi:hypothetical protein
MSPHPFHLASCHSSLRSSGIPALSNTAVLLMCSYLALCTSQLATTPLRSPSTPSPLLCRSQALAPHDLHTASRNNSNETCANHEYRQLRLPCSPLSPHPHHHLHLWTPSAALPDDLANRPPGSDPFVSPDRRQHLRKPDDRPCSLSRRQYTHGNGSGQRRCHPTLTAVVGEWTMGRCIHGYRCAKPRRHGIECLGDALGQASVSFTYPEPISDIPTLTRYPQTARKVRSRQSTTDCQQRGARWRVPTDQ